VGAATSSLNANLEVLNTSDTLAFYRSRTVRGMALVWQQIFFFVNYHSNGRIKSLVYL
jgi:hypothetical protein